MSQQYFSKKAPAYLEGSRRYPWKYFREIEKEAIFSEVSPSAKEVLELGTGAGYYSDLIEKNWGFNITCVDQCQEMLDQISNKNLKKICSDLTNYSTSTRYDLILILGALEFTNNPKEALLNSVKLLNERGEILILYPRDNFFGKIYQFIHKLKGNKIYLFKRNILEMFLQEKGLKLTSKKIVGPFNKLVRLRKAI